MKIRLDFVTNSSSSSFLIVTKDINLLPDFMKKCNYVFLDKNDNIASKFIELLSKLENDYTSSEEYQRCIKWLKLLNLDNEKDYLNYMKVFLSDFLIYYDISILDKIRKYVGYYLIYYRRNIWVEEYNYDDFKNNDYFSIIDEMTM